MKRILTTLSEKWPEYLLEILVLVVGIYGAFALDNWNENRKNNQNQIELLSNLKSDFVTRLEEMNDIQKVRTRIIETIDTLYLVADGRLDMLPPNKMDHLLGYLYISYRFNEEFSTLNMLFSTGGINSITNENLKKLLIKWPWLVQEMIEEQDRIENHLLPLQQIMSQYVAANNLLRQLGRSLDVPIAGDLSSDLLETDYRKLLDDRQFLDMIVHKRTYLLFNVKDGQQIIDHGQAILKEINKELEN